MIGSLTAMLGWKLRVSPSQPRGSRLSAEARPGCSGLCGAGAGNPENCASMAFPDSLSHRAKVSPWIRSEPPWIQPRPFVSPAPFYPPSLPGWDSPGPSASPHRATAPALTHRAPDVLPALGTVASPPGGSASYLITLTALVNLSCSTTTPCFRGGAAFLHASKALLQAGLQANRCACPVISPSNYSSSL